MVPPAPLEARGIAIAAPPAPAAVGGGIHLAQPKDERERPERAHQQAQREGRGAPRRALVLLLQVLLLAVGVEGPARGLGLLLLLVRGGAVGGGRGGSGALVEDVAAGQAAAVVCECGYVNV